MGIFDSDNHDSGGPEEPVQEGKFRRGQTVRWFNGAQSRPSRIVNVLGGGRVEIIYRSAQGDVTRVVAEEELFPLRSKIGAIRRVMGR